MVMSTPAGRLSFFNSSTVLAVGSMISSRRLCVEFQIGPSTFVDVRERFTVNFSIKVGSGIGPATRAPCASRSRRCRSRIDPHPVIDAFRRCECVGRSSFRLLLRKIAILAVSADRHLACRNTGSCLRAESGWKPNFECECAGRFVISSPSAEDSHPGCLGR